MKEMRRLSRHGLVLVVLTCGVLLGNHAAAQTASAGHEFELRAGESVAFDDGRLRLRFTRVASDSRCPVDVNCVWAGNAEVLIEVGGRGWKGRRTLRLNTNPRGEGSSEARYGRYAIKLAGLAPQPRSTGKVKAGQYKATVMVTKE